MNNSIQPAKRKSIIRWEAVGPFTIFVIVVYVFFALFFDTIARHAIESVATHANGAEVDIGSLKTSFWQASLDIRDIEVTNPDEPKKNTLQLGEVKWDMLWDAILRGKIAIENASILNIEIASPRKHAGRILPKDPPSSRSAFEKIQDQTLKNAESQFNGNVLGDLANLLGGEDPKAKLKDIQGSLKSEARIKELQAELKTKQAQWQAKLKALPQNADMKALGDRIKGLKTSNLKNPAEIQQTLQQAAAIAKDTQGDINQVKTVANDLNSDLKNYQDELKGLEGLIQSDINDIEKRMQIPKLDAESLSGVVFGPTFMAKLHKVQFYMNQARHYMPPKKTTAQKAAAAPPKPEERARGRNYAFGRPHAYPLFWLKKGELSSRAQPGAAIGNLDGELLNLTNDQPTLGLPTTLKFKGDFPAQKLSGVSGDLVIDHVTEKARESLSLKVANYTVPTEQLSTSPDATIGFKQANASSSVDLALDDDAIKFALDADFNQAQYEISAKNKIVDDLLTKTFASLPTINLKASVTGTWGAMKIDFDTNLGRELAKALSAQVQAKVAAARAQVQTMINERIGTQKNALLGEFAGAQKLVGGDLNSKSDQITQLQQQLTKQQGKAGGASADALKQQGKKGLDNLKKQFGF